MTPSNSLCNLAAKILLGFLSTSVTLAKPCFAQKNIVVDNTFNIEASKVIPNLNVNGVESELIEGGAERGQNLFYSLQEFNVGKGRGAYFVVPNDNIQNVLTRVTGNNPSEILGTLGIRQRVGGDFIGSEANLFLINPNGILFGENAKLDIGGSFIGTTANDLQFGNRGVFSATNPQAASELLTINPSAFLFSQIKQTASIQNNSITPLQQSPSGDNTSGLQVPDGKSLLLLGGNVSMDGGGLNAYGGRVELGGLTEPGTVGLDINIDNLKLRFSENVKRGDVSLTNRARIYVESNSGGDIVVNAQNLEMTAQSFLNAGIGYGLGSNNTKAGNIDVNVTRIVNLYNSEITNHVEAEARGQGGNTNIIANTLLVQDGANVSTDTHGKGKGGDLTINAQDVQLIGTNEDGRFPSGLSATAYHSTGDGGNLTLSTNKLLVQDGANVSTDTHGKGRGGHLTVNAQDVQLIGTSENGRFRSSLSATAYAAGDGGNLTLSTNKLFVQDGANVSTDTHGKGRGGHLTVNAQDVQLIGTSENSWFPSGLSATAYNSTGDGGNLTLSTNKLLVQDGANVSTDTHGKGRGGDLTINAQDVQLIGTNEDGQFRSSLSATAYNSTGDGGNLTLSTNKLFVQDGALVSTNTHEKGKGGDLTINAQDVRLVGGEDGTTGLSARTYNSTGDGGNLTLSTNKLLVQDGAKVSTDTHEKGKGGDLTVNAQDVKLIGTSENGQFSSGLSATANSKSTGDGGNLILSTNKLLVQDRAVVSTATFGEGKGGDLTINADTLQLKDDAMITAQSTDFGISDLVISENIEIKVRGIKGISGNIDINVKDNFYADNGQVITQSQQSSGGNIKITAEKNIILRNKSNIRTALESTEGSGGNITLIANAIVALEDSDILAFAPEGSGGNINFFTRAFLSKPLYRPTSPTAGKESLDALDGNNRVDVNASGSISDGTITGIQDISFLQNSLTELAQNPIDSEALIASSCVVRSKQRNGTFFITGKSNLPYRLGDAVPSEYSAIEVQPLPDNTSSKPRRRWKIGDPIVEPSGVYRLANGRSILSRECGK